MISKGPGESYTYTVEWSDDLGADTVNTSSWAVDSGITNDSDGNNSLTQSFIDLSGGTAGATYELIPEILSVGGDTYKKYLYIKVQKQILG